MVAGFTGKFKKSIMMVIDNKFNIKDKVYLITDIEQRLRIIISVRMYPEGVVAYELSHGSDSSVHYEFEISLEKNYINI